MPDTEATRPTLALTPGWWFQLSPGSPWESLENWFDVLETAVLLKEGERLVRIDQ